MDSRPGLVQEPVHTLIIRHPVHSTYVVAYPFFVGVGRLYFTYIYGKRRYYHSIRIFQLIHLCCIFIGNRQEQIVRPPCAPLKIPDALRKAVQVKLLNAVPVFFREALPYLVLHIMHTEHGNSIAITLYCRQVRG